MGFVQNTEENGHLKTISEKVDAGRSLKTKASKRDRLKKNLAKMTLVLTLGYVSFTSYSCYRYLTFLDSIHFSAFANFWAKLRKDIDCLFKAGGVIFHDLLILEFEACAFLHIDFLQKFGTKKPKMKTAAKLFESKNVPNN